MTGEFKTKLETLYSKLLTDCDSVQIYLYMLNDKISEDFGLWVLPASMVWGWLRDIFKIGMLCQIKELSYHRDRPR